MEGLFYLKIVFFSPATGQKHHSISDRALLESPPPPSPRPPSSESGCLMYVGRWSFDHISSEILLFLLITNCFTLNPQHKSLLHPLSKPNPLPAPSSFNQFPFLKIIFIGSHSSSSLLSSPVPLNFQGPFVGYTLDIE